MEAETKLKPSCGPEIDEFTQTTKECHGSMPLDAGTEGAWIAYDNLLTLPVQGGILEDFASVPDLLNVCTASTGQGSDSYSVHSKSPSRIEQQSLSHRVELSVGPYSAGSPAHSHESKWNVLLTGRKHWVLIPPGVQQFKSRLFSEPGHVLTHLADLNSVRKDGRAYHVTQTPGDVLFIPSGWSHLTINACESVAIATSMCTADNSVITGYDPAGKDRPHFPASVARELYGG